MKFGLWFEPEMISADSDLYRAHPDWAIHTPNRPMSLGRDQYVLDFGRKGIRDNIFKQLCDVLDHADIDYIKWDMNRNITELYNADLPANQQGEASHRYILGVYDFMNQLTTRYPNILFEGCSGGGGRFDAGMLAYTPQIWTSDNTDRPNGSKFNTAPAWYSHRFQWAPTCQKCRIQIPVARSIFSSGQWSPTPLTWVTNWIRSH